MSSSKDITLKTARKVDELAEKDVNTVDSDIRYMAYAARLRTAIRASTRYVAYVSFLPLSFDYKFDPFHLRPATLERLFGLLFPPGLSLPLMAYLGCILLGGPEILLPASS
jgi:hypothetical protein